jgi:hypothetical protein
LPLTFKSRPLNAGAISRRDFDFFLATMALSSNPR